MQATEQALSRGYVRARSIAEAIAALQDGSGIIVAGGVVIGSLINQGLLGDGALVDISRIEPLRKIEIEPDGRLLIGALASHDDVLKSPAVARAAPLLVEIAREISCGRLREQGTIGGGLCMIGQQGDPATGLIALGADLHLLGPKGRRTIAIEDFYRRAFEIDLRPDEILEAAAVPPREAKQVFGFAKLGPRNAMDWTQISVAVAFQVDEVGSTIQAIRIGMNGIAPAALRARQTEEALCGQSTSAIDWRPVEAALDGEIAPQTDVIFSEGYKRHVALVMLRRALAGALNKLND